MNRHIITRTDHLILSALLEDRKPLALSCYEEEGSILNHIYVGKVRDVVPYLHAAFVYISPTQRGYLDLAHAEHCIFLNPKQSGKLCQGDEILVQVSKDAVKTKDPVLTCDLQIGNKYVILTCGRNFLGFSGKIQDADWKQEVRALAEQYVTEEYGFIIRTNSQNLSPEETADQVRKLSERFQTLKETAIHRPCYTQVYGEPAGYLQDIRNLYSEEVDEILTDSPELYADIKTFLEEEQPGDLPKLRLYTDEQYPLIKCYNLAGIYQSAIAPRVWLKSGAYLVIEPTEALTVIDVNTGKFQSKKKNQDEVFYQVNKEAADEIARQLRLRNISGIVIVDFINLPPEYETKLVSYFSGLLKQDPVPVHLAGMTALGLVELTRKKTKAALYAWKQQIRDL